MKLLPSLRQKKRYLVFEIISNKKFSSNEIEKEINQALLTFLGQLGLAKAAPIFIKSQKLKVSEGLRASKKPQSEKFNSQKQRFMLKVNHKHVSEAKAALTLIKKIKNTPIIIKSLITSGTIKKASEKLN